MKVVYEHSFDQIHLSLCRGNLFQDKDVQAYVVSSKILKKYARYFRSSAILYEFKGQFPGGCYIMFSRSGRILSHKELGAWLAKDWFKNAKKALVRPIWVNNDFVIYYEIDTPLYPIFINLGEKSIILISWSALWTGPRYVVEEEFLKILNIAEKQKLSSIGSVPFATKYADTEAINGIIDAIKTFKSDHLREVRIYEIKKEEDQRIFSIMKTEIESSS